MSNQKVRLMVDKELRDEILSYCGGGKSFNSALRLMTNAKNRFEYFANKGCQLIEEGQSRELKLTKELDEISKERNDWRLKYYEAQDDLLWNSKKRKVDAVGFVAVGMAIGAAVMTFVFNVM